MSQYLFNNEFGDRINMGLDCDRAGEVAPGPFFMATSSPTVFDYFKTLILQEFPEIFNRYI